MRSGRPAASKRGGRAAGLGAQGRAQLAHQVLGLAHHDAVDVGRQSVGRGGRVRAAGHDGLAEAPGARRHLEHGVVLHEHAGQEDHVGPGEVGILERLHVHVDETYLPVGRQERGHGQQAERRQQRALADETQRTLVAPVSLRKHRGDAENLHGAYLRISTVRVPSRPCHLLAMWPVSVHRKPARSVRGEGDPARRALAPAHAGMGRAEVPSAVAAQVEC